MFDSVGWQYCWNSISRFVISVASTEAQIVSYDRMNCLSGQAWEKDFFRMADYEVTSEKSGDSSEESWSMRDMADCSIGQIL